MFGTLGWQEVVIVFVVALVLFGPKKLPELGRTIGKAITEFRRASSDLKATFEREMHSIERDTESLRETAQSYHNQITDSYYDSSYSDYNSYDPESGSSSTSATESPVGASATQGAESTATETATIAAPAEPTVARTETAETKTVPNGAQPSQVS
jgi:TatA/E family protein of Tat protein translocase